MKRYYFMIRFLPKEANLELLTGRCISVLHGYVSKHDITGLGVSFPAWSDTSIGNAVAFVHSDTAILNELKKQSYFQDMQECIFFEISQVEIVPNDCREIRFKRNQAIAKLFVGEARRRLKRLEKRAIARGEIFEPSKNTEPRDLDVFHRIAMTSQRTKQDYILHIQKVVVEKRYEPLFNSYGFATNKLLSGTVPELSFLTNKV
ncbi:type I-F CRISPR-associated endoribonuclease Cas6/Csy4 [Shewanella sp. SG41-3]|uniref:type I-F CRISPR-associated endoribonuclease Cas6/Csy4 n=1 Tax=Shewanella sp. SG41-3 TaxID=2760977 RepID=UPI0016046E16|nr:type I-F CRISPR-associated endoribonuclease Cas6/Csy4 [Shewanella sp. SG41-3]MBB1476842.1 type I-F CRISPR-associated endoribonuclease Cas6/Csy4 [Shewanella sp. SG41-3]